MDFTEIPNGESWELFCRDFFAEQGFTIAVPPGRGADAGRDLILHERLKGQLHNAEFSWLVSCKHYAANGQAIGLSQENQLLERMEQHQARGFIGFYSTVPSAALIDRLKSLKQNGSIEEYKLYDRALIEASLASRGLSKVLLQHMPRAYSIVRAIHPLGGDYIPLSCEVCDRDVLESSVLRPQHANIIFVISPSQIVEQVVVCCKGDCDRELERRFLSQGNTTSWGDFGYFCNPLLYIKRVCAFMNIIFDRRSEFTDSAFRQYRSVFVAASQVTMKPANSEDVERYRQVAEIEAMGL